MQNPIQEGGNNLTSAHCFDVFQAVSDGSHHWYVIRISTS